VARAGKPYGRETGQGTRELITEDAERSNTGGEGLGTLAESGRRVTKGRGGGRGGAAATLL